MDLAPLTRNTTPEDLLLHHMPLDIRTVPNPAFPE
jgi:hypothetical protein